MRPGRRPRTWAQASDGRRDAETWPAPSRRRAGGRQTSCAEPKMGVGAQCARPRPPRPSSRCPPPPSQWDAHLPAVFLLLFFFTSPSGVRLPDHARRIKKMSRDRRCVCLLWKLRQGGQEASAPRPLPHRGGKGAGEGGRNRGGGGRVGEKRAQRHAGERGKKGANDRRTKNGPRGGGRGTKGKRASPPASRDERPKGRGGEGAATLEKRRGSGTERRCRVGPGGAPDRRTRRKK